MIEEVDLELRRCFERFAMDISSFSKFLMFGQRISIVVERRSFAVQQFEKLPRAEKLKTYRVLARRVKGSFLLACSNCRKKHMAYENQLPCERCVKTGKEVSEDKGNDS